MASSAPAPPVVQKFKPTGGSIVGYASIVLLGAAVVVTAVSEPNLIGVRVVLGLLLLILLTWIALLRPRADATRETLRLRNLLSDHHLPLAHIDAVVVRQMLLVWVGKDRYACVGIGRSARQLMGNKRKRGPMAVLGIEQAEDRMGMAQTPQIDESADYATFVETRIEDLARSARRDLPDQSAVVRREWALPEIAALVVVVVLFVLSLVLG
jgi:hypothetical protein